MTGPEYSVVIVDDLAEIRRLVARVLHRSQRFRVVGEGANGLEAIAAAEEHQPDLLLLDISMPVCDGLEALPRIREAAPSSVVVMLSGFEAGRVERLALERGASGYLGKGISPNEIVSQLLELLEPHSDGPSPDSRGPDS